MPKTSLSELKAGAKVRILSKDYAPAQWGDVWTDEMTRWVGSFKTVDGFNSTRNTYVILGLNFPRECLVPVTEEEAAMEIVKNVEDRMNKGLFNVGDEVVVTRIVLEQKGWGASWNPKMNFAVGKKCKIVSKDNNSGFGLNTGELGEPFSKGEAYWFPEAALTAASKVDVNPLVPQTKPATAKKKRIRVGPGPWDAAPCTHLRWHLMGFFREKLAIKKTKAVLKDGTEVELASIKVCCTKCNTEMTLNAK